MKNLARRNAPLAALALTAYLVANGLFAHHSFVGLDRETVVTIEGTVVRYAFANPHVYFFIEAADDRGEIVEWEIQSGTVPLMARMGWARDTLKPGDFVAIEAHPATDRPEGQGLALTKADGTRLTMVPSYGQAVTATASTTELWGTWQMIFSRRDRDAAARTRVLTEKSQAALASYDPLTNPTLDCYPPPPPGNLGHPDLKLLHRQGDIVTIRPQLYEVERIVYMDGRGHPEDGERTNQGHSIGWFEGDVLVVDTTLLEDHPSGNGTGVPSGARKHVVERFALSDDGTRIIVDALTEDPEYHAEPFSTRYEWAYTPDVAFIPDTVCDPEVARFYLQ